MGTIASLTALAASFGADYCATCDAAFACSEDHPANCPNAGDNSGIDNFFDGDVATTEVAVR